MNFMGQRLGTVLEQPFLATRCQMPQYPSVQKIDPASHHLRFLLNCNYGTFISPFIHKKQSMMVKGKKGGVAIDVPVLELECYALTPDHTFKIHGCTVVDFANQVLCRPLNFKLPCSVYTGEPITFKWMVLSDA